jgi:O-antigen/teichoic acid export membrane protein
MSTKGPSPHQPTAVVPFEGSATASGSERVFRGALWSTAALVTSVVVGLPLTVALVRLMPQEQYGAFAVGAAIAGLLGAVGGLGLASGVARQASHALARDSETGANEVFRAGRRVALIAGTVITAVALGVAAVLHSVAHLRTAIPVLLALIPILAIGPMLAATTGYLQARRRPARAESARILASLLTFALSITALFLGVRDATVFAGFRSLGGIAGFGLMLFAVSRFTRRTDAVAEGRVARDLLRFSIPMLLTGLMWNAIAQLDVVFLGANRGAGAAALYEPVTAMVEWIPVVFALAGAYLLPEVTAAVARDEPRKVAELYHATSRWGFAIASPFVGVVLVAPSAALTFLYGNAYADLGGVARILLVGSFIHVILGFNGLVIEAYGKPGQIAARALAGLGANIVACVVLIPAFGSQGAAWATSIAFLVVNLANSWFLFHRYRIGPWDMRFLTVVASVGVAAGVAWLIVPLVGPLLLRCVVAASITGGVGVATAIAVSRPDERASMRRVLPGRRAT